MKNGLHSVISLRPFMGTILDLHQRKKLSDQNFLLAWEAFSVRYESIGIIVDNQLKILFKRIQSTVSDCQAILKAHKIVVNQWDPILLYFCLTKLPFETLTL